MHTHAAPQWLLPSALLWCRRAQTRAPPATPRALPPPTPLPPPYTLLLLRTPRPRCPVTPHIASPRLAAPPPPRAGAGASLLIAGSHPPARPPPPPPRAQGCCPPESQVRGPTSLPPCPPPLPPSSRGRCLLPPPSLPACPSPPPLPHCLPRTGTGRDGAPSRVLLRNADRVGAAPHAEQVLVGGGLAHKLGVHGGEGVDDGSGGLAVGVLHRHALDLRAG